MSITYSRETQAFITTLEGNSLEITYGLLKIIEGIGISLDARYEKNIIHLCLNGLDLCSISPRKNYFSLYLYNPEAKARFLPKLGKVDAGVSCLRFKSWDDINPLVMAELLRYMLQNPVNIYAKGEAKTSQ